MDLLISIIAIIFITTILHIEYTRYHYILSPLFLLSVPILTITLIVNIIGKHLGFYDISSKTTIINTCAFMSFALGGFCVKKVIKSKNTLYNQSIKKPNVYIIISLIIIIILTECVLLKSTLGQRNIFNIGDQEFAQGGIEAHIGNLITIFIILLITSSRITILPLKKVFIYFLIIICLFLKFASSIKAELIIPIIGGVISLILYNKIKISFRNIVFGISSIFCVFAGMAYIFNFKDDQDTALYTFSYCFFYFTCGEIGFSQYLNDINNSYTENIRFITTFFNNFYEKIYGFKDIVTYADLSVTDWTRVTRDCEFIFETNVHSLIGEIYINCGIIIGIIFFFVLGLFSYFIYSNYRKNIFLTILYSYLGACLSLSFFSSSYILLPSFLYTQFGCLLLLTISIIKIYRY